MTEFTIDLKDPVTLKESGLPDEYALGHEDLDTPPDGIPKHIDDPNDAVVDFEAIDTKKG